MRTRRFVFAALLFCALVLLAHLAQGAWAKDQDVLTVVGTAVIDTERSTVTIAHTTLRIQDGTYLSINNLDSDEDDIAVRDLAAFARRNPQAQATGEYLIIDGAPVATSVSLDTSHDLLGTLVVNAPASLVTVGDLQLNVTEDDTDIYIGDDYSTLADLAQYVQEHPDSELYIEYMVDAGRYTALEISTSSYLSTIGALSLDAANNRLTVGSIQLALADDTSFYLNDADGSLSDLAALAARHPGLQAEVDFTLDPVPTATDVYVDTSTVIYGKIDVDLQTQTVTVNGVTLPYTDDAYISNNEDDGFSLEDLAEVANAPGGVKGYVRYVADVSPPVLLDIYVNDGDVLPDPEAPAVTSYRRSRPRDVVGRLVSADAQRHTVTFQSRSSGRLHTLRIRPRTGIELNAARLPFAQLAGTLAPGRTLWLEATYEPHSHVAKKVWIEEHLQESVGQVVATQAAPRASGSAGGVTLTVAVRGTRARTPQTARLQVFPHSLVLRGRKLVRPSSIRAGDAIQFDGFVSSGQTYLPRVLVTRSKGR